LPTPQESGLPTKGAENGRGEIRLLFGFARNLSGLEP
jgi:hypothetical protein